MRETIARALHDAYRSSPEDRKPPEDPSMAEWDLLPEQLRESNRQQADHILEMLRRIGCSVHEVVRPDVRLMEFSGEEVEVMAEMQHDRWNEERLRDGWTFGPRDAVTKMSPYLVPWSELPDDVRQWDRESIHAIPAFLAKIGLEVRPEWIDVGG